MEVAIFVPVTFMLVTGLVLVTYFYFKSREKTMMIEKGLSYEQMMEFFKTKRDPYTMLKIGIVVFFFGLGLGLGLIIEQTGDVEEGTWIPLLLFTFTGIGFVVAFLTARNLEAKSKQ